MLGGHSCFGRFPEGSTLPDLFLKLQKRTEAQPLTRFNGFPVTDAELIRRVYPPNT
jgi:hypothetical protein